MPARISVVGLMLLAGSRALASAPEIAVAAIGASAVEPTGAAAEAVRRAVDAGASLVVLPERLSAAGEPERVPGPVTAGFQALARAHRIWLVAPVRERVSAGGHHASTVLIAPDGAVTSVHRKRRPGPPGRDGDGFVRADARSPFDSVDLDGVRVGILAGDDLQVGVPRLAARGARIVLVTAAWTRRRSCPGGPWPGAWPASTGWIRSSRAAIATPPFTGGTARRCAGGGVWPSPGSRSSRRCWPRPWACRRCPPPR